MRLLRKIMVFMVLISLIVGPVAARDSYETAGIAVTDRPLPPAFDGTKNASTAQTKEKNDSLGQKKTVKKVKKGGKKTKKKSTSGKKKKAKAKSEKKSIKPKDSEP